MKGWVKKLLFTTILISFLSGSTFFFLKYIYENTDGFAIINHPWQPLFLKIHILSSVLFIFLFGILFVTHITPHFKAKKKDGYKSGISSTSFSFILILSGYSLQLLSYPIWLKYLGWIHFAIGIIWFISFISHQLNTPSKKSK